jgi:hypothetical protein
MMRDCVRGCSKIDCERHLRWRLGKSKYSSIFLYVHLLEEHIHLIWLSIYVTVTFNIIVIMSVYINNYCWSYIIMKNESVL